MKSFAPLNFLYNVWNKLVISGVVFDKHNDLDA